MEMHCPLKAMKVPVDRPSYLMDEIVQLMKQRDGAYKLARRTNCYVDWSRARSLRTYVARELRKAKKVYICKQIEESSGDSHKFWRTINKEFFGESAAKISQIFDGKNNIMLEGFAAANELNKFFCGISRDLSEKFDRKKTYNTRASPELVGSKVHFI